MEFQVVTEAGVVFRSTDPAAAVYEARLMDGNPGVEQVSIEAVSPLYGGSATSEYFFDGDQLVDADGRPVTVEELA
jgi:hypothetical protein